MVKPPHAGGGRESERSFDPKSGPKGSLGYTVNGRAPQSECSYCRTTIVSGAYIVEGTTDFHFHYSDTCWHRTWKDVHFGGCLIVCPKCLYKCASIMESQHPFMRYYCPQCRAHLTRQEIAQHSANADTARYVMNRRVTQPEQEFVTRMKLLSEKSRSSLDDLFRRRNIT